MTFKQRIHAAALTFFAGVLAYFFTILIMRLLAGPLLDLQAGMRHPLTRMLMGILGVDLPKIAAAIAAAMIFERLIDARPMLLGFSIVALTFALETTVNMLTGSSIWAAAPIYVILARVLLIIASGFAVGAVIARRRPAAERSEK